jgi:hypothetical protein
MKKRSILIIICTALILLALTVASFADFGDFGGDNDFGGGGGGGDWGGGWDDDDDGYYYSGSSGGGGGGAGTFIVAAIIIGFVLFVIIKNKKNPSQKQVNVGDRSTPDAELRPIAEYSTVDPDFDAADLREKVSNLYVRMQNCWTKKDISELRPYFTDALFTQFERQLAQKKSQGLTNYIERISVQNVAVRGFKQENGVDHMIVKVEARIVDYTVNDSTGQVVSGAKDREKFMTYEWDMSRTSGAKSLKKDGIGRIFCPSCGAPLYINASARSEYCGSVISSS